ncbi:TPA: hypothetical protein ACF67X_003202 [Salmonella enterica]
MKFLKKAGAIVTPLARAVKLGIATDEEKTTGNMGIIQRSELAGGTSQVLAGRRNQPVRI